MEDKSGLAVERFTLGFNCAQSVLAAFCEQYGLEVEQALRVAGAFGGGMARLGETCGAVTGAMMAIGLSYGQTDAEDKTAKETTYQVVHQFVDEFSAKNGSILCRELLGCDLNTPGGAQQAREAHLFDTLCRRYVCCSVEILQHLIKEGLA